jgi:membrane protein implicated in regulation of membrane protease activity
MYEPWFVWALIGIACIGLEMLLPGFVIFFFGLGGLATALCSLIPFVSSMVWLQVLLFIIFSTFSLVVLRKRFSRIFGGTIFDSKKGNPEEEGIGKIAEVTERAGPVTAGRIRFQGTTWKAITRGDEIQAGQSARIVSRESMTYIIEPADNSTGQKGDK